MTIAGRKFSVSGHKTIFVVLPGIMGKMAER